jgi:iron complex outermembrane recepter protein
MTMPIHCARSSVPRGIGGAALAGAAVLATALLLVSGEGAAALQSSGTEPPMRPASSDVRETGAVFAVQGSIVGMLRDANTGNPIPGAILRLRELGREELSHGDGSFHFDRIREGQYTLVVERIGYARLERPIEVVSGDTTRLDLEMRPSAIQLGGIVVTGVGRERGSDETYQPTSVLSDAELRRRLTSSVAATIAHEPGISQNYNGPAAAQPVLRGLSGDRVLMLEDGHRTGDIATTSADHAITIDPLSAKRIEVVRGPAGLLYGSNALGGVINVIREEVPRTLPDRVTGTVSAQAESVNDGFTGGGSLLAPLGPFAVRAEASGRTSGVTRTPLGPLESTEMNGHNVAVGASWIHPSGFAGISLRDNGMHYGVPGEFNGEIIPGAHEGGVEIELGRQVARLEAALLRDVGPFSSIEIDGNYVRFEQTEFESAEVVGSRFGQTSGSGNLIARHQHEGWSLLAEGAMGVSVSGRDFTSAGSFTGSRPASQVVVAGYGYEEFALEPVRLQVGGRYDWTRTTPNTTTSTVLGELRERTFGAFSGSAAILYDVAEAWTLGASVSRAFRTPTIEELFSDGPHLADFSYNIGNPELPAEIGVGTDLFVRVAYPSLTLDASVFRNSIQDYINYQPTGELDPRFGRFPVYQARSDDARLEGAEGRIQWEPLQRVVLDGSLSYVRGTRRDTNDPLPAIPPLNGRVGVLFESASWFAGAEWEVAAEQRRTAELEEETPGHQLVHLEGGLRIMVWERLHTLTLRVDNVADRVWRDHLSRTRAVAPQPGRNIQLLYRVAI